MSRWGNPTALPAAEALAIAGKKLNADLKASTNIAHRAGYKVMIKK